MLTDFKNPIKNIRNNLSIYIERYELKSLVCGISGGIDSALAVALARPICDLYNIPLIGRSITIQTNKKEEQQRAREIGRAFCTDFQELDLSSQAALMMKEFEFEDKEYKKQGLQYKIGYGNIKARMRMIYLYGLAGKNKGLVLSTDNYTELLLGFWTLHGDVGDYGMIQNLWKTEVYRMTEYLTRLHDSLRACIDGIPTDGLGISNSDLDQIMPGWEKDYKTHREAYEAVDRILMDIENGNILKYKDTQVFERYEKAKVKRNNPYNISRENIII